jgi:hypothetical protein
MRGKLALLKFFLALGVVLVGGGYNAQAQDSQPINARVITGGAGSDATGNTNAPTRGQSLVLLNPSAGSFPQQPSEIKLTRMPANLGLRGLADSAQYKNMLRGMVTSQVPVMFQTMMMVENGAATGYIGALQSVSNFLGNSVQAADLELKMRHIADNSGAAERAYVNAVHEGLKEQSADKGRALWPVGLFYASGDRLDDEALNDDKHRIISPLKNHPRGGAAFADYLPTDRRPANNEAVDVVDTVFKDSDGNSVAANYKNIVRDVVGRVLAKTENSDSSDPAVIVKREFVRPLKGDSR